MPLYEKPHVGHEKHLCRLIEKGYTFDDYFDLIKNAEFVCRQCGRVAEKKRISATQPQSPALEGSLTITLHMGMH